MNYIELGSISVFVNISEKQEKIINEGSIQAIENFLKLEFKKELEVFHPNLEFTINVTSRRGCLIETISI